MQNSILEEVICYRIPIQTLKFLTALPTRQDGVENRDKALELKCRKSEMLDVFRFLNALLGFNWNNSQSLPNFQQHFCNPLFYSGLVIGIMCLIKAGSH